MSEIKVVWNQRVAGRFPGHVETVEETTFILGCIKQGRCEVVPVVVDIATLGPEVAATLEAALASPTVERVARRRRPVSPEPTFEAEVEAEVAGAPLLAVASALEADGGTD